MRYLALVGLASSALLAGCASTPLLDAAKSEDLAATRSLLEKGADPNQAGAWGLPLTMAACLGNIPILRELIQHGANVNAVSSSMGMDRPMSAALGCDNDSSHSAVQVLLAAGATVSKDDVSLVNEPKYFHDAHTTAIVNAAYARQNGLAAPASDAARTAGPAEPQPVISAYSSDIDQTNERRGTGRPDDFALVIGVEEYQSLPKAEFGVRDAEAARAHLAALGLPERNIVALEGSAATASKLKSYLQEWLPLNVKPDSTLFVYYSGHGAPDPKSGDAYLVPWDGDPKFLRSTAYPLKQLYADLLKTKAKRIVVALDSCFSGAGGRSVLAEGTRPLVVKVDAGVPAASRLVVLAAASGDETTGTLREQGHGAFTYFFLKGLSGAAKTAAGDVTPKSLYDYLAPRVQDEAHRQNREQTPTLAGGTNDESL